MDNVVSGNQEAEALRILIHCNGAAGVGIGHVIRSLALAEEAQSSGHEVTFVGEYGGRFVSDQLRGSGAEVRESARGARLVSDLQKAVEESEPDVVHLDTYDDVEMHTHALVSNIQDHRFGRRRADLVINPTLGAEYEPDTTSAQLFLRGTRYAPLRTHVTVRRGRWKLRDEADRVLVVMGGTDPQQLTPRVLDVLARTGLPLHVTAIANVDTRAAVDVNDLRNLDVKFIEPTDDLPGLAIQQDLVISAAGTSVWEFCCLGVPMALVCAVENQLTGYERVVDANAAVPLGATLRGTEGDEATQVLNDTLRNAATREVLARKASQIVDGLGAWRVVRAWEQLFLSPPAADNDVGTSLVMRRASLEDAETLLRWRNDPQTRARSRQTGEVPFENHFAWLKASLENDNRLLLIAYDEQGEVGTVRWDLVEHGVWEVSITVAPKRRGKGMARALLSTGEHFLSREASHLIAVEAEVHETNDRSRRLFSSAGYVPDQPADEQGFLRLRKPFVATRRAVRSSPM